MNSKCTLTEAIEKLKVLAVTKTRSVDEILELSAKTGITSFAENRLLEAKEKIPSLPKNTEWHFIGKLQSRKIHEIVKTFDVIQSVENIEQARKISECGVQIKVMVQVNISGRDGRSGVDPDHARTLIESVSQLPNLELIGLMGMASPLTEVGEDVVLEEFKSLKDLQGDLDECSMGMSGDWPLAIEAGATMLRLGRILFES